jgi:transmembrane sensor
MDKVQAQKRFQQDKVAGKFDVPEQKTRSISRAWLVAASIILLVGLFAFYQWGGWKDGSGKTDPGTQITSLKPGGGQVTLTVGNGSVIDLSKAVEGLVAADSGIVISRSADGMLQYSVAGTSNAPVVQHVLETKAGGTFKAQLPDGSAVWLNALSRLSYPSRFTGAVREVELLGEGYFEIAPDAQRPFQVRSGTQTVEVLGTHFNINAYTDEPAIVTTLLEGSVQVTAASTVKKIKQGQQAVLTGSNIQIRGADTANSIAWKNHTFKFSDASVETVMRQVSRWYGAEIVYQDKVIAHFNATVDRTEPIDQLLHYLESTGQVHFKVQDKKIIVMK